jgi:hypothetical protein
MRKLILVPVLVGLVLILAPPASAAVYNYFPTPSGDLWDLDHYKAHTWGINWTHPGEYIVGAKLEIKGIWDWTHESGDSLYITLLDDPQLGVTTWNDNQGGGNKFDGWGPWVGTFSDPYGDSNHKQNLTYDLAALGLIDDLQTFAGDGTFGFGLDADCHYFNDCIQLTVETSTVPEPATMTLLGLGLIGVGALRRRKV